MKKIQETEKMTEFVKEAKTLHLLNHPNILRFYGVYKGILEISLIILSIEFYLYFLDNNDEYFICTEFVNEGDLEGYLKQKWNKNNKLDEKQLLEITLSCLKGLRYLER